ncbi:hypothetical protein amrb99_15130 [Actinomadura sp. RB99]|nr:hypothetical protein [Actinomadura sp. RB99]
MRPSGAQFPPTAAERSSSPALEIPGADEETITGPPEPIATLIGNVGPGTRTVDGTAGNEKAPPEPDDRRTGDLQSVFTSSLLAIVSAYSVTGSVWVTLAAAVVALLVALAVNRRT